MRIPKLNPLQSRRQVTSTFGGIDKRSVIEDGSWRNTQNVTLDEYPTLKVRGKRGTILSGGTAVAPTEIVKVDGKLCYIEGSNIHIGSDTYAFARVSGNNDHSIIVMGAYLIILPEYAYFNTSDPNDKGMIESDLRTSGDVTLTPCDETGDTTAQIKNYTKVSNSQIDADDFNVGDGIEIYHESGETNIPDNFVGYHVLTAIDDGYFVYKGAPAETTTISATHLSFYISRGVPVVDVIFECGNRLWGARWGKDIHNEKFVNEIYASALGDFRNWRIYEGAISTNSYTASVGTGGKFTGGCAYQGVPTFFKEDAMFRVYGSYPEQYQIQETACNGVIDEGTTAEWIAGRSLSIVNNVLYYKSRTGVCAFDGSLPVDIGAVFGKTKYHNAVGGAFGKKYYLSMADENNVYHLFVYDTAKGLWIREDNTRVRRFAEVGDELYFIWYDGTNRKLMTVNGTGEKESGPIEWFAETGELGLNYQDGRYTYSDIDRKYIERLTIRMRLGIGSYVSVEISYNDEEFKTISRIAGYNLDSFSLPVPVKRCDHFRLRLSGRGDAQIYSIAKLTQGGSDK
jgi:hypothetical protein